MKRSESPRGKLARRWDHKSGDDSDLVSGFPFGEYDGPELGDV